MKFKTCIKRRLSGRHKASLKTSNFRDKKILDIGSSFGWFEKYSGAKKILAIDICKKDLKIAKKKIKNKNIKFRECSVLDVNKIIKEKFDMVVMFDVIEHIPKNREVEVLKKLNKVLNKNGELILTTPCKNFTNFFDPAWYFGHRHYSKKELLNMFKKSDFEIKEIYSRGGFFEIFSMFLFYPCKWIFNSEIPFKIRFDKERDKEYLEKKGFVTWFVVSKKSEKSLRKIY